MKMSRDLVVMATFRTYSRFRVPEGIDIQKLLKEEKAYVLWDTLYILMGEDPEKEDQWIEIKAHIDAEANCDWKRPSEVDVDDYDNKLDSDDDEEETQ